MNFKPCSKCGQTFQRAMILALMCDFGAKCSPPPDECPEGGYHDFEFIDKTERSSE